MNNYRMILLGVAIGSLITTILEILESSKKITEMREA